MIAVVSINNYVIGDTITPPAGWVPIRDDWGGIGTYFTKVFARKREAGEATYTFTVNDARHLNGSLLWLRGAAHVSQWVIGTPKGRSNTPAETVTITPPSITTTEPNTQVVSLGFERTNANEAGVTWSGASEWFFAPQAGSAIVTIAAGFKPMVTPGSTGNATITYPNTQNTNGWGYQIGIPPVTNPGLQIKVSDGSTLQDAWFQLADGAGGLIEPGDMKVVRPGYRSVSHMLAQDTFYIAHRGGSRDFPEMSLYAYGQSALLGYPALELSIARTSDGVFFGLHDYSLDRTSGVTGVTASSLTWAQVQNYEILGSMAANNPSQSNQPYMRWEELIELYYDTHIIFIDPKVLSDAQRQELLDRMDELSNSTDRFVGKYFGVSGNAANTNGPAKEFSDRGYKTWGYFYQDNAADFATYQGRWDILGMDYNADQPTWNTIKSYGKPVVGHIVLGSSSASTALSKGADGLMVAGVRQVVPPSDYLLN